MKPSQIFKETDRVYHPQVAAKGGGRKEVLLQGCSDKLDTQHTDDTTLNNLLNNS